MWRCDSAVFDEDNLVSHAGLVWPEYLPGAEHGDVEYALTREAWVPDAFG